MDIFAQYATDPSLELDGAWITIGPAEGVLEDGSPDPATAPQIKVARNGNKRYNRILTQLWESNEQLLKMKNDASEAKSESITIEVMSKSVLLGWKNLSFKGRKLEDGWNIDDAKTLLGVKDFRDMVNRYALDAKQYAVAAVEEAGKN